jgi:hypothetical protein
VKVVSSPAKVEEIVMTSHEIDDDAPFDLPSDDDMPSDDDDVPNVTTTTSTTPSSCTSCAGFKNKIHYLQKRLSWYKKTKANLQNKVRKLEAERNTLVTGTPAGPAPPTAELDEQYSDDESQDEHFGYASSMDYASLEESSQSVEEMEEEDTKNTIRYCKMAISSFSCLYMNRSEANLYNILQPDFILFIQCR